MTAAKPVLPTATGEKSELLMPAGNLEKLKIAVLYGADAVYLGTPDMSLRSKSDFSLDDVIAGVEFAHAHGVRVYLTLNLFAHNKDIPKLQEYVETVRKVKPDGLIVADPGVFHYIHEQAPDLPLHVSTQANVCSWMTAKFWQNQGAELVVMARETSYSELKEVREQCPDLRLEAFVHGSMCMTYSGRCLLSNYMAERGANQGSCANSCRWKYKVHMRLKDGTLKELELTDENLKLFEFFLEEEFRGGELMEIVEDERGSYILNAKDLCLLPVLDAYLSIGVDSLKVEGRGRSPYYVAVTARAYRNAIDDYYDAPQDWNPKPYMEELYSIPNRGYSLAFHEGRLSHHAHNYEAQMAVGSHEFAGLIREVREDAFILEVKNRLDAGDVLEFLAPRGRNILLRLYQFENVKNGEMTEVVHAGQKPMIRVPFSLFHEEEIELLKRELPPYTVVRKEHVMTEAEWERFKLDQIAIQVEEGTTDNVRYLEKREDLLEALAVGGAERTPKTPRIGASGCCGKGCNGCLPFWHDDAYAKAREKLAARKQGEMLERQNRLATPRLGWR